MNNLFRIFLLCGIFAALQCSAQRQERQLFVYNFSFGAVTGGIGAVINKPKEVKWTKAFVRGAWQGSVGGLVNYSAKRTIYLINKKQEPTFVLPAKLLHAAGSSIIENAALYQPFLRNWNIDYGPVRFDFSPGKPLRARFLPESIYAVAKSSYGARLNVKQSLLSGVFVFDTQDFLPQIGTSWGRAIIYSNTNRYGYNKNHFFAHEILHTFQYRDYQIFNAWLTPLAKRITTPALKNIFTHFVYFDAPYFTPVYLSQVKREPPFYYGNFFEFEAERFSTNSFVRR